MSIFASASALDAAYTAADLRRHALADCIAYWMYQARGGNRIARDQLRKLVPVGTVVVLKEMPRWDFDRPKFGVKYKVARPSGMYAPLVSGGYWAATTVAGRPTELSAVLLEYLVRFFVRADGKEWQMPIQCAEKGRSPNV